MTTSAPASEAAPRYQFEWDAGEFRRAHRRVMRGALYPRWVRLVFWFAMALIVVSIVLAVWAAGERRAAVVTGMVPWLLLLVGWFALVQFGFAWIAAYTWARQNPVGHRTVTYSVGPAGLEATSYLGQTTLRWVAIKRLVETSEFFLFYITWQCAHYIPKRVISPEASANLRAEVRAYMPPEKLDLR